MNKATCHQEAKARCGCAAQSRRFRAVAAASLQEQPARVAFQEAYSSLSNRATSDHVDFRMPKSLHGIVRAAKDLGISALSSPNNGLDDGHGRSDTGRARRRIEETLDST